MTKCGGASFWPYKQALHPVCERRCTDAVFVLLLMYLQCLGERIQPLNGHTRDSIVGFL